MAHTVFPERTSHPELTILVVDDNKEFTDIIASFLIKQELRVDTANDGLSGLQMYLANPMKYSAVLLDIQMPVLDGYEVAKCIRTAETDRRIPIIALSGSVDENNITDFDLCLRKPFQFEKLLPAILEVLK